MNPSYDFTGRVAFVTGASSGMGLATARAFAEAGAAVTLADVNADALAAAETELGKAGHRVLAVRCDVADEDQVAAAVAQTVKTFGRLDLAYNNAGIQSPTTDAADEPAEVFDRTFHRRMGRRSVAGVEHRKDVHDFLASRRARITPAQAGLPVFGDKRRVAGLRREEVASLAGVSVDYYARLERGNLRGVSESVLEALVRALRLDEAERAHLFDLARTANAMTAARSRPATTARRPRDPVRQSVRGILAGMTGTPAYVRNARMDILAANDLCTVLYDGFLDPQALPVNLARFVFLDDRSRDFFGEWDTIADDVVGALRTEVGRSPADRALSDLVGELTTRSDEFSARWARHNVRLHNTARKTLHSSLVGDIELAGDALQLAADGLIVIAYSAAPGTAEEKLSFLASWAAQTRPATEALSPAIAPASAADRNQHP